MLFDKLADVIMKKARLIVALWIVILIVSVPFIMKYNSVLQYDMSNMSSSTEMESIKGNEILQSGEFNSSSSLSAGTIILVETKDSLAKDVAATLKDNLTNEFFFWDLNEKLRAKGGLTCEITVKQMGRFDDKYFADSDTQMIIFTVTYPELPDGMKMKKSDNIPAIRDMVKEASDGVDGIVETYVTGTDAMSYDTSSGSTHDIKHIDPISILLVLILIGLFFKSFVSAGTPPVVIGMAYGILLALVYAIGSVMGIYYITTILVLVSMLGAGCDYCIFIISRYREERIEGKNKEAALRESIIWAGESIITSGISVVIGFGSLALCSFSLVSTMGIILALGIVLALLAALTFVPALLMLVGDRIFWPSSVKKYREAATETKGWYAKVGAFGHRYFTNSAHSSIKYAKVFTVVTILITVPMAYLVITNQASYDMISAMPPGEAKDGVDVISHNIGGGLLMPTTVTMKVDAFVDLAVDSTVETGSAVPSYSTLEFTAHPATGYRTVGWIANGTYHPSELNNYTYHVEPPITEPQVTAVFEKIKYTVEFGPNDSSYGSLTTYVSGEPIVSGQNASYGNELKFVAAPNEGYTVDYWTIARDGIVTTEYIHDTEITIGQASYDYIVTVYFAPVTDVKHTVTFAADGNGSLVARSYGEQIKSGDSLLERSNVTFSAIPGDGYRVIDWIVDGVAQGISKPTYSVDSLAADTSVTAVFEQNITEMLELSVTSSDVSKGTVSVTVDGKPWNGTDQVPKGSKIVITANPIGDNKVLDWQYTVNIEDFPLPIPVPAGDQTFTSYINKTEHVIDSYTMKEGITVDFGVPVEHDVTVTIVDPILAGATIVAISDGEQIHSGDSVPNGSSVFFIANIPDGYRIDHWTITSDGVPYEYRSSEESLSLYDLNKDTEVTYHAIEQDYVLLQFGANNDDWGSVECTCAELVQQYVERPNAPYIYSKLNEFANNLMNMTTEGKKNVAMAIGPMNGDILFDGQHEWLLDTVANVLPSDFQGYVSSGITYDALTYVWKDLLNYGLKNVANYYLAYRLGFISKPFTETEGGQEYQYVKFMVVTKDEPMSALSVETIKQIFKEKDNFISENYSEDGSKGFAYSGYLSGAAVQNYEMSELVNKDFKFIIVVVIILLILLLFLVMRSYLTPIRAVGTILMSVIWTLGLTYLIFDILLGIPVVWVVPIVLFVVCLGLGMDYDILLTTRIRENVMKGMTNDEAIVAAVQKSGAIITLCGLIMAGAFGTMMVSTSPMLKEFGFALGFAIAVDALVIRTYIVPAIMHLMGDWNWKGPDYAAIKAKLFKKKAEEE